MPNEAAVRSAAKWSLPCFGGFTGSEGSGGAGTAVSEELAALEPGTPEEPTTGSTGAMPGSMLAAVASGTPARRFWNPCQTRLGFHRFR